MNLLRLALPLAFVPFVSLALAACSPDGEGAAPASSGVSAVPPADDPAPDGGQGEAGPSDGGPTGSALDGCGSMTPTWTDGEAMFDLGIGGIGGPAQIAQAGVAGDVVVLGQPKGGWVRVNAKTRAVLQKGPGILRTAANGRFVVSTGASATASEIRDLGTGALIQGFEDPAAFPRLPLDASYVFSIAFGPIGARADVLRVWTLAGVELFSRTGAYRGHLSADGAAIRIARPDGTILVVPADGTPESAAVRFVGTFESWFTDGKRFVTRNDPDYVVYEVGGTIAASFSNAVGYRASGYGNTLWVQELGAKGGIALWNTTSPASVTRIPSSGVSQDGLSAGRMLVAFDEIVDLGATPPKRAPLRRASMNVLYEALVADAAGNFVLLDTGSAVQVGDTAGGRGYLGCGSTLSVAGASNGKAAIVTASGHLVILDTAARSATTMVHAGNYVDLAKDGSRLAITRTDSTAELYDLPSMGKRNLALGAAYDVKLSPNGGLVATAFNVGTKTGNWALVDVVTGTKVQEGAWDLRRTWEGAEAIAFSPGGTRMAVLHPSGARVYATSGVFSANVPGEPLVWLTDDHLMTTSGIYDAAGQFVRSATFPSPSDSVQNTARRVTASTVFFPRSNVMIDQTTGATVWSGSPPPRGENVTNLYRTPPHAAARGRRARWHLGRVGRQRRERDPREGLRRRPLIVPLVADRTALVGSPRSPRIRFTYADGSKGRSSPAGCAPARHTAAMDRVARDEGGGRPWPGGGRLMEIRRRRRRPVRRRSARERQ